jgi:hypothetical protein
MGESSHLRDNILITAMQLLNSSPRCNKDKPIMGSSIFREEFCAFSQRDQRQE